MQRRPKPTPQMDRRRRHERLIHRKYGAPPPCRNPAAREACRLNPLLGQTELLMALRHWDEDLKLWLRHHPESLVGVLTLDDGGLMYCVAGNPELLTHFDLFEWTNSATWKGGTGSGWTSARSSNCCWEMMTV